MARFPSPESLAAAEEQEVLSLWQGLGYYRRGRMLHAGARFVVEKEMPRTAADWRLVPGVGAYTAGAIASIAFGEPTPVVDGNVERVFARWMNCEAEGIALNRAAWAWAAEVLDRSRPGDWNQALMELGATICTPRKPLCPACPIADLCAARRLGTQESLPRTGTKVKTVERERVCWIPVHDGLYGVRQIPPGHWWEGMWEFPTEANHTVLEGQLEDGWAESIGKFTFAVTHHRVRLRVSVFRSNSRIEGLRWVRRDELEDLPLPAPQRKALNLLDRLNGPDKQ